VSRLRHPRVQWLLGAALGLVFLYASVDKILAPREFARIVYHYQLIGPGAVLGFLPANTLAVTLPWLEAVLGVLLVTGVWRREAALAAACLLVMFLIAVTYALALGIDIENCGCFSLKGEGRRGGMLLIASDLAMLATALLLALTPTPARLPEQH
jgi:uncharacterized membrane protein YphA (DoxX/SURF4 family)